MKKINTVMDGQLLRTVADSTGVYIHTDDFIDLIIYMQKNKKEEPKKSIDIDKN
jgi:hypothetical protein